MDFTLQGSGLALVRDFQKYNLSQQNAGLASPRGRDLTPIENASGADRARFEVLGTAGSVIGPMDDLDQFVNRPAILGTLPAAASHWGKFVVLAEPVRNGAFGMGWPSRVCPADGEIVNDHRRPRSLRTTETTSVTRR